jgi:hypothetical protein
MRNFIRRLSLKLRVLAITVIAAVLAFFGYELYSAESNLTWTAPTTMADGSPLTDLAGYKVYWSLDGGPMTYVADSTITSYLHADLSDGEHCYQVTAFRMVDGQTLEGAPSNTACRVVDRRLPGSPSGLTIQ